MKTEDPLKKREDFAVSLRKKKKETIMKEKRKRLMKGISNQDQPLTAAIYRRCPLFSTETVQDDRRAVQELVSRHIPGIQLSQEVPQAPEERIAQVDKLVRELVNPDSSL